MKYKKVELIDKLLILLLVLMGVAAGYILHELDTPEPSKSENILFEITHKFAATHNYSENYDCKNYSQDLSFILSSLGYENYIYHNYNKTHAYNLIAIEPQTGMLKYIS